MIVPPRDTRLAVEGGELAALRMGDLDGTPVLALHGWLDNAASFVPLADHLPGVDLVALDLPGHGASMHLPAGAEYSLAGTVLAVLDAADALGWTQFTVLGHSMGASVGCLVAAAAPDRVRRLVAIEALGALADAEDHTAGRLRDALAARRALRGKRLRVFPDVDAAVRARMQANALDEPVARLLVERGLRDVDDGHAWSSDPRLTVSTPTRMTEGLYSESDLKGLSTDLVSPAVVGLASDNAPTRTVLLAGAGAFEQAHVTMTRGIHVGDRPDAAEQIAAQWSVIADRADEQVPASGSAQYHHEVRHPDKPTAQTPARETAQERVQS